MSRPVAAPLSRLNGKILLRYTLSFETAHFPSLSFLGLCPFWVIVFTYTPLPFSNNRRSQHLELYPSPSLGLFLAIERGSFPPALACEVLSPPFSFTYQSFYPFPPPPGRRAVTFPPPLLRGQIWYLSFLADSASLPSPSSRAW